MNAFEEDRFPLVSIITLNFNQASLTESFLVSSKKLLYPRYEILVCDMDSEVNPATVFDPGVFPNTKLLLSPVNLGFAGGNNWGISQAKGSFIFIVNNDTELTPDILDRLLEPFSVNPLIGVTCPKIKYFEERRLIQYAGFRPMNRITGRTTSIGDLEPDTGQYDVSEITYGAHGCAMMVKKEVIEKTGMFPEKFFLYYEEWDWSVRIRNAGYLIWYQADATIYHKNSMSVGKDNPKKDYYHVRNRILFMRRNSNPFYLFLFFIFFTLISVPKSIYLYLRKWQLVRLKWFMKGIGYNLTHSSRSPIGKGSRSYSPSAVKDFGV